MGSIGFVSWAWKISGRPDRCPPWCTDFLFTRVEKPDVRLPLSHAPKAEAAAATGMIPPRFVLQRVADQLDGFTGLKPAENVLVTTFGTRLAKVGVPEAERGALVAAAEKEVRESVSPAYGRVRAMVDQQISRANGPS
jgi:uncharacterized protein (DUF885 family)